jgi:hypothetical protein
VGDGSLDELISLHLLEVRANPCLPPGPRSANCGKQMGTPPRSAAGAAFDADETYICSAPSASFQLRTCAPKKATSHDAPDARFRITASEVTSTLDIKARSTRMMATECACCSDASLHS